jgi:hypothetical protein
MTANLSISVSDGAAACLQGQGNASAAVTAAVRRVPPDERRVWQRAAAEAHRQNARRMSDRQLELDATLIESSNDISLHGSQW